MFLGLAALSLIVYGLTRVALYSIIIIVIASPCLIMFLCVMPYVCCQCDIQNDEEANPLIIN